MRTWKTLPNFAHPNGTDMWKFASWPMDYLLHYVKLCASFQIHRWIQTGVIVRKCSIRVKIGDFFVPCDLEIWRITLKNNRAPLLCHIKLHASFHLNKWIQITVMVRKRLNWVLTTVTLTLDLWPRAFDWTSLLSMVITPGNFIMIRWLPGASWWDRRHPTEHMT